MESDKNLLTSAQQNENDANGDVVKPDHVTDGESDSNNNSDNNITCTTTTTTTTTRNNISINISDIDNDSDEEDDECGALPQKDVVVNEPVRPSRISAYKPIISGTDRKLSLTGKPRKRVTLNFNSFDYFLPENEEFLQTQSHIDPRKSTSVALLRWLLSFLVGLYVAVIAIAVTLCNKYLTRAKLTAVYELLEGCSNAACLLLPGFVWMVINMALVAVGAYLVTFHAPLAAGSGIPNVKCYLNGIRMPGLMSLKTLLAKAGGVVLSVSGGLACGKEGPMIHSGAICASTLASADFHCGKKHWKPKVCDPLRTDEERRDFVAAGAASGVSAAFGSPIGGVLFSLEEGASFLRQMLTWRMLFSSLTACLVLNILLSAILGQPGNLSQPGLVCFGLVGDTSFGVLEIPIFILMGVIGGLFGAAFVQLNYKITLFRRKYVRKPWLKVGEAVMVAGVSAIVFMSLIYIVPDCKPIRGFDANASSTMHFTNGNSTSSSSSSLVHHIEPDVDSAFTSDHSINRRSVSNRHGSVAANESKDVEDDHSHDPYGFHGAHGFVFQGFCPYGEHNRMADILFKTGEGGLHAMLHAPLDEWSFLPLIILVIVYHLLATWTYGLSVSSGVFIPSLLIGAIWGRVVGMVVMHLWAGAGTNIAKYALIGAAANLGGATRMTLSLTVIVIECTGDITFGVPIMLALIVAKWVGDFFNPGIYDLHIEIQGIPLLPWDPPAMSYTLMASDVMTSPVDCLQTFECLGRLRQIIANKKSHNGYPVVDSFNPQSKSVKRNGRLKGFLLKSHLQRVIEDLEKLDNKEIVDLNPHMNVSPYTIHENTTLPRIFKIFRGLGLRHLVVVNDRNRVVGMITRINLARYRSEMHRGCLKMEELAIADS